MKFIIEWIMYSVLCAALGAVGMLALIQQHVLPTADISVKLYELNEASIQLTAKNFVGEEETFFEKDVYVVWDRIGKTGRHYKNYCNLPDERDFEKGL